MVTDGNEARIITTVSGAFAGKTVKAFFERQKALEIIGAFQEIPCPADKIEKEKRIVYAFQSIQTTS